MLAIGPLRKLCTSLVRYSKSYMGWGQLPRRRTKDSLFLQPNGPRERQLKGWWDGELQNCSAWRYSPGFGAEACGLAKVKEKKKSRE